VKRLRNLRGVVLACCLIGWSGLDRPDVRAAASQAEGIATRYSGDAGIARDPRVLFVENFEEESLDALWQRWETVGGREGQSFAGDVPSGSHGKRSLEMDRQSGSGPQLYRRLKNPAGGIGFDPVFARYYVKFDPDCGEIHHFGTCLGGNQPTAALDSHRGRQVMELFRKVARERGSAVIVVTHDHRSLDVFDRTYEMEDGALRPAVADHGHGRP
jgi:hypothetical protein